MYMATAKSLQSCPTLCDPIDGSPPGSPIPGILQARTLEWGAIAFSKIFIQTFGVGMAAHSSIFLWEIPWTEEPGRLQSMELQRVGHD